MARSITVSTAPEHRFPVGTSGVRVTALWGNAVMHTEHLDLTEDEARTLMVELAQYLGEKELIG